MLFAIAPLLILVPIAKYGGSALVGAGIAWSLARGGPGGGNGGSDETNSVAVVTNVVSVDRRSSRNVETGVVAKIGFDYVVNGKRVGGIEDIEVVLRGAGTNVCYNLSQLKESPESFEKVSDVVRKVGAVVVP